MSGVASTLAKKRALAAGFGTNSNAVQYMNQNFEALRAQCRSSGQLFCDPTFPAEPQSLGFKELGRNSAKIRGVIWKRPTELVSNPEFIVGGATRTDICQGALGEFYTLSLNAAHAQLTGSCSGEVKGHQQPEEITNSTPTRTSAGYSSAEVIDECRFSVGFTLVEQPMRTVWTAEGSQNQTLFLRGSQLAATGT
ncbi:hypothetical protein ILYODFUR_029952 [Ilyodon furcidens]|uniref:Calpain catalytic domain-containing protein n=1 Tax=Ilyodon furcidens TaxID=33524 RepID=A0ABV0V088_9TELE